MAWTLSLLEDEKLDICWLQFMQIYLGGCSLYGFDRQKVFGARYKARKLLASREHGKYDENNVEHRGNLTTKS